MHLQASLSPPPLSLSLYFGNFHMHHHFSASKLFTVCLMNYLKKCFGHHITRPRDAAGPRLLSPKYCFIVFVRRRGPVASGFHGCTRPCGGGRVSRRQTNKQTALCRIGHVTIEVLLSHWKYVNKSLKPFYNVNATCVFFCWTLHCPRYMNMNIFAQCFKRTRI